MQDYGTVAARVLEDCAFPSVAPDGRLADGGRISQPPMCRSCGRHSCAAFYATGTELVFGKCHRGLDIAYAGVPGASVVLNGLVFPETWNTLPRRLKKEFESNRVTQEEIRRWFHMVIALLGDVAEYIQNTIKNSLAMFHDVHTSASVIIRNAEDFIATFPGANFEEKFDAIPPAARTLVKSAQLLEARLGLMPLLVNPESAHYGRKKSTPIYRVVDKLVRVLRPTSKSRNVEIQMSERWSANTPRTYASFETIPLVIIENAIKYALPNSTIEIDIDDVNAGVSVRVSSLSPFIPVEERGRIFDRGFRSACASAIASKGSGLGLYLAAIVADAHQAKIVHTCESGEIVSGGITYCKNTFEFTIV